MGKDKPTTCPECGGPKQGRGYSHQPGCSMATRGRTPRAAKAGGGEFRIDGRTRIADLLKLQVRVESLLAEKDQKEVKKVKDALANVEKLRAQLAEAEALIG